MGLKNNRPVGQYVSILGKDGTLRISADKPVNSDEIKDGECNEDGVTRRDFETSDGTKGVKWEKVYTEISGRISEIAFKDTNFGRMLNIFIGDGDDKFILSTNSENNFTVDMMKKLPNIDLEKDVTFSPYAFKGDDGKPKKGVSIKQGDEKILNFFYDVKKEVNIHDFPEVDEDKKPESSQKAKWKKFWKAYFSDVEDFLVEYTEQNTLPVLEAMKEKKEKHANGSPALKTAKEVKDEVEEGDPLDDF